MTVTSAQIAAQRSTIRRAEYLASLASEATASDIARGLYETAQDLQTSWASIVDYVPEPMPWETLTAIIRHDLRAEKPQA